MKIHTKPIVLKDLNLSNFWLMDKLSVLKLDVIAKDVGFVQRVRKPDPVSMLTGFFMARLSSDYSLANWALQLDRLFGLGVSKQGIWNRLNHSYSLFLEQVLFQVLKVDLIACRRLDVSPGVLN